MGWIGKAASALAKGVVKDATAPIAIKAADLGAKAIDKSFEHSDNKVRKKVKSTIPGEHALLLEKKRYSWNDKYTIYDSNERPKYTVKGSLTSLKRHLFLYDLEGNQLGSVKEKLLALRSPLSMESSPSDFEFEINGEKVGKMKTRYAMMKDKYAIGFAGWKVEGNFTGTNYKIYGKKKTVVAEISSGILTNYYALTFPDPENELLALLIVLAINAVHSESRSYQIRETIHHKTGGWL